MPGKFRLEGSLVLLFAFVLYLATTGGSMATDTMSYEVAKGIVEHGSVAMSRQILGYDAHRGADGRFYSPYGIGHALYGIPFYVAGRMAEEVTGLGVGKPEALRKAFLVLGNGVASALTVWLTFLFALRLGGTTRSATLTALTLGFGTLLWPYATFGFSAPLTALTLTWGTYGVWVGTRQHRPAMLCVGGVGLGCALLVRHELVLATVPVGVWLLSESGGQWKAAIKHGVPVAIPVAAAILATLYYNEVRFGSPWDTGYLRDGTIAFGSIGTGLMGLLVSPGRSLFLFAPVTLLGVIALGSLWRRDRATAILFGGIVGVLFLFYASLEYWDADRSYGPRYLVAILPFLCLPLVTWFDRSRTDARRRMLVVFAALSVVVQVPGVMVDFSKVGYLPELGPLTRDERLWTWRGSGLRLNVRAVMEQVPVNVRYVTGVAKPPAIQAADARAAQFSEQFAFSLDFWWLYLFYARAISAPAAVAAALLLLALAAGIGRVLKRLVSTDQPAASAKVSSPSE